MPPAPAPQAATRKRKRPAPNVAFHSVIEDDGRGHQREVVVIEDTPPPAVPPHVPSPATTPANGYYGHQSAYPTRSAIANSYVPPPPSSHVSSTSLAPSLPPMPLPPRRTRAQAAAASAASSSSIPQLNPPATKRRRKDNAPTTPVGSAYETSIAPSVSAIPSTGPSSAAFARKAMASKAYQTGFNAGTTSIKQWPVATIPSASTESIRDSNSSQISNRPQPTVCDDKEGHYIIKPDDIIHSRYRVVRLLGQGTFGKVVEAIDMAHPLYSVNGGRSHLRPNADYPPNAGRVAIKIIRAVPKYRDASKIEIRVLKRLKENCIHYLETFDHRNHICIVTQLLGQCLYDFLKENQFTPFPRRHIQDFARSLLDSVAFLHDLQLIHTDLKPENILLVDSSYDSRPMPAGLGRRGQSRHILRNTSIRLIDFGSATFSDEYHSTVVCTRHYRAPEIILGLGWSFPCDAFSLGCILVELYTGVALFQTHDNLEHLAMMEKVMGKMPERLCKQGQRYKPEFFATTKGAVKLNFPNRSVSAQSKKEVKEVKSLHQIIPSTDIINQDFLDLVQRLLNPDPNTRITVREALKHRYFSHVVPIECYLECFLRVCLCHLIVSPMFNLKAIFSVVTLWVSLIAAQHLTINEPSSDRWWVAQSLNTLRWNCEQTAYTNWTVLITNPDVTILSGPLALIAIQWNYDCSKTIIPGEQLKPATGYVMQFANALNSTDVWASSQPFEVKAVGSTYPPEYTSVGVPGTSQTGTGSGSSGTAAPTTTSTPSATNGAVANTAISALFGLIALSVVGFAL
ncbi:dual-specificity kinase [Rhizoctonia solani AG-1 IB]|uniref:Dual-specificity kinase n=2 Tax=Thanatephorus cucumeris (strain AG1-IB / isolate 7/3/14) TaxID=1108050 RepID=M5BPF2_THACB|nr:dual-specificity kinase [Rhizoctonia solani AG-1 IB]